MRTKAPPKPNIVQAQWLARIARSKLMKTHGPEGVEWSLLDGTTVPAQTVAVLIRHGWVKPNRDGLSMFDAPQTYEALVP